jgi:uncharacterized phage protein gp47/JayE
VTFTPRAYDEVVRDLLTTLTGGTVRESFVMPPGLGPILLNRRPVRRISHLEGFVPVSAAPDAAEIKIRFTPADFELISSSGSSDGADAIRFREDGRKPIAGTQVLVNYYPVQTPPLPLTDLNVGSVTRTLLETVAREIAMIELGLDAVYKSAFLDTADDTALDRVVALVGVSRLPAGHPVAQLRFSRASGGAGRIAIPTGTPVTTLGGDRYLTSEPLTIEPGELAREVGAVGESAATALADANTLTLLEVAIAGVESVTNPQPARRLAAAETDDELRRRARAALAGVVRGTNDALRFGLKSIRGVKDAVIVEEPNGVPGEIRIEVAYESDDPEPRAEVERRIREIKPAGIRVVASEAARRAVDVRVALTLAGTGVPSAQLGGLQSSVEGALRDYLRSVAPGGRIRRAQLSTLALKDGRIVDATVTLVPAGASAGVEELQLESGEVVDVRNVVFDPPATEQASTAAITSDVTASIPVHVVVGVTLADATAAIGLAFGSYLTTRGPSAPITVDGLLAAIRDDTRFAAVRAETIVTVESGTSFVQLSDGLGSYAPAANETLRKGALDVQPRDGV